MFGLKTVNNMIKFRDVAHLYLGCKIARTSLIKHFSDIGKEYHPSTLKMVNTDGLFWIGKENDSRYWNETDCKPVLRPLSVLTGEEKSQLEIFVSAQNIFEPTFDPRQYELNEIHKAARITKHLISMNFDLFGLIDSGQAIDATTLTSNPYTK